MDDGVIFQPSSDKLNQSSDKGAEPAEAPIGIAKNLLEEEEGDMQGRVFDITPDLNISPLPTEPGNEPPAADIIPPVHTTPVPTHPTAAGMVIPSNIPRRSELFTATPPAPQSIPQPQTAPVTKTELPNTASQPSPAPISKLASSPSLSTDPNIEIALSAIKPKIDQAKEAEVTPKYVRRLDPNLPRDPNLKPLRTYESDVANALAREQASVASIAIAEAEKKQQEQQQQYAQEQLIVDEPQQSSGAGKKVFLLLVSLIFIGAGIIGSYYLYSKSPLAPAPQVQVTTSTGETPAIASLIPSDSYVLMPTDNLTAVSLKNRVAGELNKTQPESSIVEIIPTRTVNGQTMRVSAAEMVDLMDLDMPDILLRSFGQPVMIGIHTPPRDSASLFVVVTTEFYQNTFKGMLEWESVMADDLKFYLLPDTIRGVANTGTATSTASSTPESVTPLPTLRGGFVDRIIRNKDVRQFITEDNRILFMYSFVDNNKLIITDKEATIAEVLTRLEKAASIR